MLAAAAGESFTFGGPLIYLDAFVPEDGDSCWSMANDEERQWYIAAQEPVQERQRAEVNVG